MNDLTHSPQLEDDLFLDDEPAPAPKLVELTSDVRFASVVIVGEAGTGKTRLAMGLSAYLAERELGLEGGVPSPVGVFDTEKRVWLATQALRPRLAKKGIKFLRPPTRTRQFGDVKPFISSAEASGCSAVVFDQVTHLRRDVQAAYRAEIGGRPLTPADREIINEKFRSFTDELVNLPFHTILVCRAADLYEIEDVGGERKSVATGLKIDAGKDLGYEPMLVIQMETVRHAKPVKSRGGSYTRITQRCTVLKDSTGNVHGKVIVNPKPSDFAAVFDALDGEHVVIDTDASDGLFADEAQKRVDARERSALLQEIDGTFAKFGHHGGNKESVQLRAIVLQRLFDTTSRDKIAAMELERLRELVPLLEEYVLSETPPASDSVLSAGRTRLD